MRDEIETDSWMTGRPPHTMSRRSNTKYSKGMIFSARRLLVDRSSDYGTSVEHPRKVKYELVPFLLNVMQVWKFCLKSPLTKCP